MNSKIITAIFAIMAIMSVFAAQEAGLQFAIQDLCTQVRSLLGVAMFMMVILAAVVYAVGQIMGAETRARATVWATAMFTGAIIAGIIVLVVPNLLKALLPEEFRDGLTCEAQS